MANDTISVAFLALNFQYLHAVAKANANPIFMRKIPLKETTQWHDNNESRNKNHRHIYIYILFQIQQQQQQQQRVHTSSSNNNYTNQSIAQGMVGTCSWLISPPAENASMGSSIGLALTVMSQMSACLSSLRNHNIKKVRCYW